MVAFVQFILHKTAGWIHPLGRSKMLGPVWNPDLREKKNQNQRDFIFCRLVSNIKDEKNIFTKGWE